MKQISKKEITEKANKLFPSTKPRHYFDEGQRIGFIKGALWILKEINYN